MLRADVQRHTVILCDIACFAAVAGATGEPYEAGTGHKPRCVSDTITGSRNQKQRLL
jgi:hypothetical protein